jgi:hypothetical protein
MYYVKGALLHMHEGQFCDYTLRMQPTRFAPCNINATSYITRNFDPGSHPGRHGGKPATSRLTYDTANLGYRGTIHG